MNQEIIGNKVFIDGKEITDCPKGGKRQTFVMTTKGLFVNGYEYKNGKWKRTLRAIWHLWL